MIEGLCVAVRESDGSKVRDRSEMDPELEAESLLDGSSEGLAEGVIDCVGESERLRSTLGDLEADNEGDKRETENLLVPVADASSFDLELVTVFERLGVDEAEKSDVGERVSVTDRDGDEDQVSSSEGDLVDVHEPAE